MHTPHWSILAAALSFSLALGCSVGQAPVEGSQHDGGLSNHLGDASFGGTIQLDSGTGGIHPGGGGGADAGSVGGGGGGTGSGVCGTGAGTGDTTTDTCLNASCCASFAPCYADATCLACLSAPSGAGCSTNSLFTAFDTCWSNNCASSSGGGGGGGTGTAGTCCSGQSCFGDTCDDYIDSACCNTLDACLNDSTCNTCLTSSSAPSSCDSNTLLAAFADCLCGGSGATSCSAECGGSSSGGGGGTAGTCCSGQSCFGDTCDDYIDSACCDTLDTCLNDTTCYDCLTSSSATGCDTNAAFGAFGDCVCGGSGGTNECATECGG